jgi:hypothetical protein
MQKKQKTKKQKNKKAKKQKSKKAKSKKQKTKTKKNKKQKNHYDYDYMNEVYLWESSKSSVGKLKYPNAETDSGLYAIPNNGVYASVLAFAS